MGYQIMSMHNQIVSHHRVFFQFAALMSVKLCLATLSAPLRHQKQLLSVLQKLFPRCRLPQCKHPGNSPHCENAWMKLHCITAMALCHFMQDCSRNLCTMHTHANPISHTSVAPSGHLL